MLGSKSRGPDPSDRRVQRIFLTERGRALQLLPGLELIETSGHVPGHQSVLVRLPETGPMLLTIDAVAQQRSFIPKREAAPMDMDQEMLRASTLKLLALGQREQVSLTILGMMATNGKHSRKPQIFIAESYPFEGRRGSASRPPICLPMASRDHP